MLEYLFLLHFNALLQFYVIEQHKVMHNMLWKENGAGFPDF